MFNCGTSWLVFQDVGVFVSCSSNTLLQYKVIQKRNYNLSIRNVCFIYYKKKVKMFNFFLKSNLLISINIIKADFSLID